MKTSFINKMIFIFSLCVTTLGFGQESESLKKKDISRIMEQIFSEHLGQKQIDEKILQQSFKVYIDQFDPDRTYLLQTEVKPYLQFSTDQLGRLIGQYRSGDYVSFEQLNSVIQKAILRAREIRKELIKEPELIFKAADEVKTKGQNEEWLDPDLKRLFAENETQLKTRIREQMVQFVQAEQKRYGKDQVVKYKEKLLPLYDQALSGIEDGYLYQANGKAFTADQEENALVLHILKSLASALDAHTAFYSNSEAYDMKVRLEKEFEGIGVVLQQTPDGIIIASLVDGGPASKSGKVFAQDRILQIDDRNIKGEALSDVMDKMRGKKGTPVKLLLSRNVDENGKQVEKQVTIQLERAPITVAGERVDVQSEKFGNGVIGMITLHSFYQGEDGEGADTDVKKAIEGLDNQGTLRGLILDLRENSGGFLTQAVKVAGLFISNGVVVISKYSDGDEKIYRDVDNHAAYQGPLVILTSKATASAAEIVAQALQDYGVAVIVGDERTYGKGTIQSQTVTGKDKATSFFKVTVGKYYTVSGKTPQLQGVKSDIVVPGPFSREHIGEEYLEHPLQPDKISAEFNDDLNDIDPGLKKWYLKYYVPTLQHKVTTWIGMLPNLQKNSQQRLKNNKNYQTFLKQLDDGEINLALFKNEKAESSDKDDKKGIGHEDLQMQEAVNIIKDMVYLHGKARQEHSIKEQSKELQMAH
jgi:carboxyl-terminal processing protease